MTNGFSGGLRHICGFLELRSSNHASSVEYSDLQCRNTRHVSRMKHVPYSSEGQTMRRILPTKSASSKKQQNPGENSMGLTVCLVAGAALVGCSCISTGSAMIASNDPWTALTGTPIYHEKLHEQRMEETRAGSTNVDVSGDRQIADHVKAIYGLVDSTFGTVDTNRDNNISRREFNDYTAKVSPRIPGWRFSVIDRDKDQYISRGELFADICENMQ